SQNSEPANLAKTKAPPEKEATWADASKDAIQQNEIRVELGAVAVRNVRIRDVLGEETVAPAKYLTIQVFLNNTDAARKIDFLGWSGAALNPAGLADLLGGRSKGGGESAVNPERNAATLTDNFKNPYKRLSLELGAQVPGQIQTATSVYPGKRVEDLLV